MTNRTAGSAKRLVERLRGAGPGVMWLANSGWCPCARLKKRGQQQRGHSTFLAGQKRGHSTLEAETGTFYIPGGRNGQTAETGTQQKRGHSTFLEAETGRNGDILH